jgi:MoxR-like ATPase
VTLTVRSAAERLVEHVGAVVVGKREVTEQLLGALLVEGHVLLDDVPGVGKTTLARSVARSLDLSFRRIQCTPDLVPSDITGVSIYDQRAGAFEYRRCSRPCRSARSRSTRRRIPSRTRSS